MEIYMDIPNKVGDRIPCYATWCEGEDGGGIGIRRFDCISCCYDCKRGEYRFEVGMGWIEAYKAEVFVFTNKSSNAVIPFEERGKELRAERVFAMRKEQNVGSGNDG